MELSRSNFVFAITTGLVVFTLLSGNCPSPSNPTDAVVDEVDPIVADAKSVLGNGCGDGKTATCDLTSKG